jgi:outer membrane protein TolC
MLNALNKTLWGIFFFLVPLITLAQNYAEIIDLSMKKNDIQDRLPPLHALLDSAEKYSPLLKIYDSDIIIQQLKIKAEKREWMQNMGFEAGARYGLFDNLILKEDLGTQDLNTSTTEQTRYNIGVFLRIPLSSVIDKSNIQLAHEKKNKLKYEKANGVKELRQLIIVQYNNILKAHKKMIINAQQVESFRIQMMRAEKEYENGIINAAEFARLSEMYSGSLIEQENSKSEFITAFQLLQESTGIKIQLKTDLN